LLYKLKETERQAGDFYQTIHQKIKFQEPQLAELFKRMANDERIHEKQVEMAIAIYKEAPDQFSPQPDAIILIDNVLQKIQDSSVRFQQEYLTLTPAEILDMAVEIEVDMEERHQSFYLKIKDSHLGALFRNILDADSTHIALLKKHIQEDAGGE